MAPATAQSPPTAIIHPPVVRLAGTAGAAVSLVEDRGVQDLVAGGSDAADDFHQGPGQDGIDDVRGGSGQEAGHEHAYTEQAQGRRDDVQAGNQEGGHADVSVLTTGLIFPTRSLPAPPGRGADLGARQI
jgi:hypothetical protein